MNWSKPIQVLYHLLWFSLFAMAILQYKERLFADASYYFFHAINSGGFHVEHGRIVLGLSQILPLLGYYFFLPLKVLMVLASLGHELFYYVLFLVMGYHLKDKAGAIALLMVHLIGQLWLYYSPMLEICYGAGLAVFFYSILRSGKTKDDKWFILLLLVQWFAMSSHPENFLLIGFALGYDYFNRGWNKSLHLYPSLLLALGFLIEILTFSEYELGHTQIIHEGSPVGIQNLLDPIYLGKLFRMFLCQYWDLLLLLLLGLGLGIYNKSAKAAGFLILCVLALIGIVNQVALANVFTRYFESMYNPLVALIVIFAVYEAGKLKAGKIQAALIVLFLLLAGIRAVWTYQAGDLLRKRVAQLERLVDYAQELGHSKYLINGGNFHSYYTSMTWANPIETLLFSAIDGKEKSLSIAEANEYYFNRNHTRLNDSNYMFRRFEIEPLSFLNDRLFDLKKEPYHKLNNGGIDPLMQELKQSIQIDLLKRPKCRAGDTVYFFVEIQNPSPHKLPSSLEEKIYLSYHWLKEGEMHHWDGQRSPLEVDVYGNYRQHIQVILPAEPGNYQFRPDLVVEGKMWFDLSQTFDLSVY